MSNETILQGKPVEQPEPRHTSPIGLILGRWPAVLGLVALDGTTSGGSHLTSMIIVIASMCYLAAAALGSRRSVWVMAVASMGVVVLADLAGLDPTLAVLVMGVGFAVLGLLRGGRVDRREVGRQGLAFAGFSAVALTAMMVAPVTSALLAAAAAIGHAVWDAWHFLREEVVSRSLAEACFVLDLGLGLVLLATVWGITPW